MPAFHFHEVSLERRLDGHRQHRLPVLLAFAPPNDNLVPVEVDVLHSQLETLLQTQTGSIEERHDDPHRAVNVLKDLADLLSTEHDRNPMRHLGPRYLVDRANFDAKHMTIQKQHGAQRLILSRRTDTALGRQP